MSRFRTVREFPGKPRVTHLYNRGQYQDGLLRILIHSLQEPLDLQLTPIRNLQEPLDLELTLIHSLLEPLDLRLTLIHSPQRPLDLRLTLIHSPQEPLDLRLTLIHSPQVLLDLQLITDVRGRTPQTSRPAGIHDDAFSPHAPAVRPSSDTYGQTVHDPYDQPPRTPRPQTNDKFVPGRLNHDISDQQGPASDSTNFSSSTGSPLNSQVHQFHNVPPTLDQGQSILTSEAQNNVSTGHMDTEEKQRQRLRLRELILRQQQQKNAVRQEKGLQEQAMTSAATPLRHWPQEDLKRQSELFGRPPPPYPGIVRIPRASQTGQRFPGLFANEPRSRLMTDGQFNRPPFSGDVARMVMRSQGPSASTQGDSMVEKLDSDEPSVKDLDVKDLDGVRDLEVKDLDDEDLENLNLDPVDGKGDPDLDNLDNLETNDPHLDDLLKSGEFDLIAYTDPELDLGDKKDMFNEELELNDPIDDKLDEQNKTGEEIKCDQAVKAGKQSDCCPEKEETAKSSGGSHEHSPKDSKHSVKSENGVNDGNHEAPFSAEEQPLLLQDLLEQERQEQQQQRQMQAMIRHRSTDSFFPNIGKETAILTWSGLHVT
eukprot:g48233.t1